MTIENPVPQDEVLQLTPYNAKYDAFPLINFYPSGAQVNSTDARVNKDALADKYQTLIAQELPRLINMSTSPAEITKDHLKAWLGQTPMRYFEVPSEVPRDILVKLENDLAKVANAKIIEFAKVPFEILGQSWGYDDFGKQDPMRQIWEDKLTSALKMAGVSEEVYYSVRELGGIFNMGKTANKLMMIELINDEIDVPKLQEIRQRGADLANNATVKYDEFRNCENYTQRHSLLVSLRAEVLKYLQDLVALLPKEDMKKP
jgi:hypothetical protein